MAETRAGIEDQGIITLRRGDKAEKRGLIEKPLSLLA
jgi:hypothetical protein